MTLRAWLPAVLLLLLPTVMSAQEHLVYPTPAKVDVQRDLRYRDELPFDLYRPPGSAVVPVVVFANIGSADYREWPAYVDWARAVTGSGLAGVLYRASDGHAAEDLTALLASLRARSTELRIDPDRVVLWAASSNVQVGLPAAMNRATAGVVAAVIYYGPAEVPEIRTDLPLLLVRSGLDGTRLNQGIDALVQRAFAANAPWTVVSNGAGLHAFDLRNDDDISRHIIARTLSFLSEVTQPKLVAAYRTASTEATLGAAFARQDWTTAIEGYRALAAAKPQRADVHWRLGLALQAAQRHAEALPALERAWELGIRGTRDVVVPAARAAAQARNADRALHWLALASETRFGPTADDLRTGAEWAEIRGDARFTALVKTLESRPQP